MTKAAPTQSRHANTKGERRVIRNALFVLGRMLYEAEDIWDRLTEAEQAQRVAEFQLSRNLLADVTGEACPVIESPWNQFESEEERDDVGADARYPGNWYNFAPGADQVARARLMVAVTLADARMKGKAYAIG